MSNDGSDLAGRELLRRHGHLVDALEKCESALASLRAEHAALQAVQQTLLSESRELKARVDQAGEVSDDLRNLFTSHDLATVFVDPQMRIKRFTPYSASLLDIVAGDVGRPLAELTHRLDYPEMVADAREVFVTLRPIEREVAAGDGQRFLARFVPYRTADDRIGGAVLDFVDVTRLRRAEAEAGAGRESMQMIADMMTDFAVLTIGEDGTVKSWSSGASRLFGYQDDDIVGRGFDLLFTGEDRAAGLPAAELAGARRDGRLPCECWMARRDGSRFYASGVTSLLNPGGAARFAKICRDMTSMRELEELQAMQLTEARAQNDMKSGFLAVMSHELKHPLNLISVNAQLLTTLPEAQGLPAVMRAAQTIQRTVQGQARIIDDLLDMSRTHTGKLVVNRVPLLFVEAIESCMTWALAEARGKGVRLYAEGLDEPLQVDGDPVRVEQIAWNLLSNAIKFTRAGGSVTARLARDGDDARFEVADTGRGISSGFLPHVFELFQQADAPTTRPEGGLGIGLALVKNLVELHGGRIEARSEGLGRGSTFCVWLPLHVDTGFVPLSAPAAAAGPALRGVRVLLVDDTEDTLETFGFLLEHEGALVTPASSGMDALRIAGSQDFDIVVSDVGMPQMDGYEMMRELRSRPRTATLPAIALTGYGRPEDVAKALAAGFHAHIDKPVDFERVRQTMRVMLKLGQEGPTT